MKKARFALGVLSLLVLAATAVLLGVSSGGGHSARSAAVPRKAADPDAS
jgi:hypothetical protein